MITNPNLANQIQLLPSGPGVYLFKDKAGETLYIGKAKNLRKRVTSYGQLPSLGNRTRLMINQATLVDHINVDSEFSALLLEAALIRKFQPHYNVISRDDKSPLYIMITKEKFPRVRPVRLKDFSSRYPDRKQAHLFGPFPSGSSVRVLLKKIRKIIPFCDSKSDKGRSCLHSYIGLCNPCPRHLTRHSDKVQEQLYRQNILRIRQILTGKIKPLVKILTLEMENSAQTLEYEKAAQIRDQINKLNWLSTSSQSVEDYLANPNLIEDQREIALSSLKKVLGLAQNPKRIECFDVSHTGKELGTAAMTVAVNGEVLSSMYRHFKIKFTQVPNDTAAIKETLQRRFTHTEWGIPDLIVIDGGKTQLSAGISALNTSVFKSKFSNLRIIALAKQLEQIYIPDLKAPISIAHSDPGLLIIMRLRDEAHRFSRRLHHKLRSRRFLG